MSLTPTEIISIIEQKRQAEISVRERMDLDYSLWRLDTYTPSDDQGLDGFRIYTSNEPRTFSNKISSLLISSILTIRAEQNEPEEEKRRFDNAKERFAFGILRSADERLRGMLLPPLKDQLEWFTTKRGRYAVRALLAKRKEDDSTFVDILPFDPYHTYWEMGPDGLAWACYVIRKTSSEIKAQYGVTIEEPLSVDINEGVDVYDFYDMEENKVFTESMEMLKTATKHGSPRVPIAIGYVGGNPLIQTEGINDFIKDRGDSIYQAVRETYRELSFAISGMSEFVKRSLKQPVVITSRDGTKALSENPWIAGSEISLSTDDKVEPLDLMTMAQETGVFLGLVTGEIQRGSLPHSAFGELQFQLSGFAINSLRQGMATVTEPPRLAMVSAYTDIMNILIDQYLTDQFDEITLSGRDRGRQYFKEAIPPEKIEQAGDLQFDLVAKLPQDDLAAMSMAIQSRTPDANGNPLLPDRFIRENTLGLQDSDIIEDQVREQMANQSLPLAAALNFMDAAVRAGDSQLASIWLGEAQKQMIMTQMQLQALALQAQGLANPGGPGGLGGPGGPGGPGGGMNGGGQGMPPGPPGVSSSVAPPATLGMPPMAPTPQMGPIVPNGTPRPGAMGPGMI